MGLWFTCCSPSRRSQVSPPHRAAGAWGPTPFRLHNLLTLPETSPFLLDALLALVLAQASHMSFHGDFWIRTPDHRPADIPCCPIAHSVSLVHESGSEKVFTGTVRPLSCTFGLSPYQALTDPLHPREWMGWAEVPMHPAHSSPIPYFDIHSEAPPVTWLLRSPTCSVPESEHLPLTPPRLSSHDPF